MEVGSRIPEKLFFRIGEVCELIKVQPHVLRYWETEFPMLAPQKNRAGQRVYRRRDVEMVVRIRDLLYEEKFTIAGAKKKLMEEMRGGSSRPKLQREAPPAQERAELREPLIIPIAQLPAPVVDQPAAPQSAITPQPAIAPQSVITPPSVIASQSAITPQVRRAIRLIKRDLEDLLTMLNSDASIKSS